jgi:hypothetical protein
LRVAKAVMAPNVARRDLASVEIPMPQCAPPQMVGGSDLIDEKQRVLQGQIRELRDQILANSEDVGANFPAEARRIHEGETPSRLIRGEATALEVHELLSDGIDIMPVPVLPEEMN